MYCYIALMKQFSTQNQRLVAEADITELSNDKGAQTSQGPIREVQGEAPPTGSERGITEGHVR